MKIVSFISAGRTRLGFLAGDDVIDPVSALGGKSGSEHFTDAVTFLRAGDAALKIAKDIVATAPAAARVKTPKLVAPMMPTTILCSGSNYKDHNAEKANTPISGKEPEFFIKTADCVVGPDEPIVHDPAMSMKIDCETELAIVIGKAGRHIPVERALDHVFGYTICNDVTARDRQVRRSPEGVTWYELGRGKAFDTSAPLGPCIVTADEVGDPQTLDIKTRINGELRQSSNTENMIWTCAQLVHFFSTNFTLRPGMVIITGTPAGTAWSYDKDLGGKGMTPPGLVPSLRYCEPGDVVESEVEKIGVLRNTVVAVGDQVGQRVQAAE